MQIRTRLTLQFISICAGILLISLFYIYTQFKNNLLNEFNESLHSKSIMIAEMVVGKVSDYPFHNLNTQPLNEYQDLYRENISIYDQAGQMIYSFNPNSSDLPRNKLAEIISRKKYLFSSEDYQSVGIIYTNQKGLKFVVVAEGMFNPLHLENLTRILLYVFFLCISLISLGGWIFAGQALAPIRSIMNQVDEIIPNDLGNRLKMSTQGDEISRLVITFNRLLDRIQKAFKLQEMFLSNISHEIKNPLNIIISQIEVTLARDRKVEEYLEVLDSVRKESMELNEVGDKLLQLAKVTSEGTVIHFSPIRIDELVWQSRNSLIKSSPEFKVHIEVKQLPEDESKLYTQANEHLLKICLINIMENGCKFSSDHSIRVALSMKDHDRIMLVITDKGPGISKEEIDLIFNPFYRGRHVSKIKGAGIGLTLAKTILELHNIELQVDSVTDEGTHFVLIFPKFQNRTES